MREYKFKVLCGGYTDQHGGHYEMGDVLTSPTRLDQVFTNAFLLLEDLPDPEKEALDPFPFQFSTKTSRSGVYMVNELTGRRMGRAVVQPEDAVRMTSPDWTKPWTPVTFWKRSKVFIIGGGPSLKEMDLSPLEKKNVLGTNDAFQLGDWVDVNFFGDYHWLVHHQDEFRTWPGMRITNHPDVQGVQGIFTMQRRDKGFGEPHELGWHLNSGCGAVLLAIALGATTVYLLGYDLKLGSDGQSNWHPNNLNENTAKTYRQFHYHFEVMAAHIAKYRPDVKVINITPGSALEVFPRAEFEDVVK